MVLNPPEPDVLQSGSASDAEPGSVEVSHNVLGQKLGRKGRQTRERILAVAADLIAEEEPLSLSAVARRVPLGMTSLYNYFSDLTELFLAVLDPVMATAEEAYVAQLRTRWPDEELAERCYSYACGLFDFWSRNARLLHLRNALADSGDIRVRTYRVKGSQDIIRLMIAQMDADPADRHGPAAGMATVLITGIERSATVANDAALTTLFGPGQAFPADHYLKPGARIMEMAIRDMRARIAAGQG